MGAFLFSKTLDNSFFICSYSLGNSWIFTKAEEGNKLPTQLEENSTLSPSTSLHTKESALCEFKNDKQIIRIGAHSVFEFKNENLINLIRGSMLLYVEKPSDITIQSDLSKIRLVGKFTVIIDCTSNGGFKIIPLEGKGKIIPDQGEPKDIFRGRLTMVLGSPSRLGNAYDIDLLLLLKSSRLINSFPSALPSMKRISLSIYAQQLSLKGKFNALIGDAPTDDNLQMWAFGEGETK